jgi:hypothetical protein
LSDQRVGLGLIEELLALLREIVNLLRRGGGRQGLVGGLQLLMKLIDLGPEDDEFATGVLILPERRNGLGHLVRVNLACQLHADDHGFSFEAGADPLTQDQDHTCGIGPYLIFGNIQIGHDRDAFQVGRNLFEGVPLRGFRRQTDGVFPGIAIAHPILPLGSHDLHFRTERWGKGSTASERDQERQGPQACRRSFCTRRPVDLGRHGSL